jgi:hypothetical protein
LCLQPWPNLLDDIILYTTPFAVNKNILEQNLLKEGSMNGFRHMTIKQIHRALGQEPQFNPGAINPVHTIARSQTGRLPWEQVYKQLGPECTLDLMSGLHSLEKLCRNFCWLCLRRLAVLDRLSHSEYCLNVLHSYALGLSQMEHMHSAYQVCRKAVGKLDYETEQVLRQANAALIWVLGLDTMFSPAEMLRRITYIDEMNGCGPAYTQICLDELGVFIKAVDAGEKWPGKTEQLR